MSKKIVQMSKKNSNEQKNSVNDQQFKRSNKQKNSSNEPKIVQMSKKRSKKIFKSSKNISNNRPCIKLIGQTRFYITTSLLIFQHILLFFFIIQGQVRLRHFLGRALRLGQARGPSAAATCLGRALQLAQARGPSAAAT